jgi:putative transposase
MPWRHPSPLDQTRPLIAAYLRQTRSLSELCERYGVRRTTGDKWRERDLQHGPLGPEERSRQPHCRPRHTPTPVVEACIERRRPHPAWGAKKRLSMRQKRHPRWPLPARSTVCELFRRPGLVPQRRHRRHRGHPGTPTRQSLAPHALWSADVKGHFTTGDERYGEPLTVAEGDSRFRLGCQALSATRVQEAPPVFTRVFKALGLPQRSRPDQGVPWATNTLAPLAPLAAWWGRLGLLPECIEPGTPQQNGRPARMHRRLKAETTRPPAAARHAQQRTFDRFRPECHVARPQEALDLHTPASCSEVSPREMPTNLPPVDYPDRFAGRDVRANGGLRWTHHWGNVAHPCLGA